MATIDDTIAALQALKAQHGGDVDVTVWQYAGGDDVPCDIQPRFDEGTHADGCAGYDLQVEIGTAMITNTLRVSFPARDW